MNFVDQKQLPVHDYKDLIQATLLEHQVVIVAGDTGCGKTTQLPQFCLDLDDISTGVIGCTQPRRIAAITVAERVKEELGDHSGKIGYQIRFQNRTGKKTKIKFMTDGILLAETRHDPLLKNYSVIIVDEAHERSLNIDFLLGFLKNLLPKRPDLKLIVTSATIDTTAFANHFSKAPIINIEGRTYPVDIRYAPIVQDHPQQENLTYLDHCTQTILDLHKREPVGDILVFLPTEKDIRSCCNMLNDKISEGIVLPLFGRLQAKDQKKIFQVQHQRKIVVATNVAETSITVPNIRYVVDTGLARISYYNSRAKTTSLPIQRISKASCDQRKGRCGRIGPGICIRLYSEEDYHDRPHYSLPEIQRANLADVILQMVSLKLGRPEKFPFIDSPSKGAIKDGYRLLTELGAINNHGQLTRNGKLMARLPIDPCISRIIIESQVNRCLREIKIIGSALALQDPRVRPAELEQAADTAHKLFAHSHSDFMALLNIWNHFHGAHDQVQSWSRLKKFCKKHFLSFQRMREWFDLHEQMSRILDRHKGFTDNVADGTYEAIHKSLTSGFLRNIGCKKNKHLYLGANNRELMIFPGSHQFLKSGKWIVAASFLETNRLYALTVATIEADWLEVLAGDLCTYSWTNPRWQKKTGRVICDERVSLFGLVIEEARIINFGRRHKKNRKEAQTIFIQHGLVQGEITGDYPFLQHNFDLIEKWRGSESKLRKRDIVIDDYQLHDFYRKKLPAHVFDRAGLNDFLRANKNQQLLMMSEKDILSRRPENHELLDFPNSLTIGNAQFKLEYNFEPGSEDDGVTIRIPIDLAQTINPAYFEWLIPGLLAEKTEFLIKGLPKKLRKQLVPVTNSVDMVLDDFSPYHGSYYTSLENALFKFFSITIRRSDWPQNLPPHLQMRFLLFDTSGNKVASGRDLKSILQNLDRPKTTPDKVSLSKEDRQLMESFKNRIFDQCDFDKLPSQITLYSKNGEVSGFLYPTLTPEIEKKGVSVTFEKEKQKSTDTTVNSILYLYRLQFKDQFKLLKNYCSTALSGPSSFWFIQASGEKRQAVQIIMNFIMESLFCINEKTIPPRDTFQRMVKEIQQKNFYRTGSQLLDKILLVLRKRYEVNKMIQHYTDLARKSKSYEQSRFEEYQVLLAEILPENFLELYKSDNLDDCLRYLNALVIRIERAHMNPAKDVTKSKQLHPHLQILSSLPNAGLDHCPEYTDHLRLYRQMIQEFRISLFAPEMKTKFKVSEKKLKHQFQLIKKFM